MVDLKKLDWTKCKLNSLPCLMASGATRELPVRATWDESHRNAVVSVNGYHMMAKTGHGSLGWQFLNCDVVSSTDDMIELTERAKEVNAFIAAEIARIEAEEENANWIMIHWRDVEWLIDQKVKVRNYSSDGKRWTDLSSVPKVYNHQYYHADRRTLPAGYDPEKPRWVEIERSDVVRLERAGCAIRLRSIIDEDNSGWGPRLIIGAVASNHCDYQVDMHTVPPGVPLHEEPNQVPRARANQFGGSRPCTKAFAMAHPNESEARYTGKWYDSGWDQIDTFDFTGAESDYEFRTTVPEEPAAKPKPRIISSVPVSCIDMAKEGPGSQIFLRLKTDSPATYNQCVEFVCKPSEWTTLMHSERKLRLALIVDEES